MEKDEDGNYSEENMVDLVLRGPPNSESPEKKSIASKLREIFVRHALVLFLFLIIFFVVEFCWNEVPITSEMYAEWKEIAEKEDHRKKAKWTLMIMLGIIVSIFLDYESWIVMVLANGLLSYLHCVHPAEAWEAMGMSALMACCAIPAVAKGIGNTHIVKNMLHYFVKQADDGFVSLLSLLWFTGFTSIFLDNFAVIGMFTQVYRDFSKRTGHEMQLLLMPMSFMVQLGGTGSLLASGCMLVVDNFIKHNKGTANEALTNGWTFGVFGMFLPSLAALSACSIMLAYLAPLMFAKSQNGGLRSHSQSLQRQGLAEDEDGELEHTYVCKFMHHQTHEKMKTKETGTVSLGEFSFTPVLIDTNERDASFATGETEFETVFFTTVPDKLDHLHEHGLRLCELRDENTSIRFRSNKDYTFAEAIVDGHGPLDGKHLMEANALAQGWEIVGYSSYDLNFYDTNGDGKFDAEELQQVNLRGGDMVLLWGPKKNLNNSKDFVTITPCKQVHSLEKFNVAVSLFCLAIILFGLQLPRGFGSLLDCVLVSLVILVVTECITLEEMLHKFKWTTLLMIAGSYGLKLAIDEHNLDDGFSNVIKMVMKASPVPLHPYFMMYLVAMSLSMFFPPKAGIGILFPVSLQIAKDLNVGFPKLLLIVVQATAVQCCSHNNPENHYVNCSSVHYSSKQFLKLGFPTLLLSGIVYIFVISFMNESMLKQ